MQKNPGHYLTILDPNKRAEESRQNAISNLSFKIDALKDREKLITPK